SRSPTACPAPMNSTASAALRRERVRTSPISNIPACAHTRAQARPTLPEPMIFSVFACAINAEEQTGNGERPKRSVVRPYRFPFASTVYRSLAQDSLNKRLPFPFQRRPWAFFSRAVVPVIGIGKIAFFTMQIGMNALGALVFFSLHDLVRAVPVAARVVP